MKSWLVNRDPYTGFFYNPYITGWYNPLSNPTNQGFDHYCSNRDENQTYLKPAFRLLWVGWSRPNLTISAVRFEHAWSVEEGSTPWKPAVETEPWKACESMFVWRILLIWLAVSTHLKNISQIGSFPQIGVKIKNIWNHHPVIFWIKIDVSSIYLKDDKYCICFLDLFWFFQVNERLSVLPPYLGLEVH